MIPREILEYASKATAQDLAYRAFLERHNVDLGPGARDDAWFSTLPISAKDSYVRLTDLKSVRGAKGLVPEIAYASSGSSGTPTFWMRDEEMLEYGVRMHEHIVEYVFGIKKEEPTLVLVTFSMGLWIAGLFTADSFRSMRARGWNITIATPGIDKKEGIAALAALAAHYTHVIIAGYPPFVLDFLREAGSVAQSLPSVFILAAGDKFSEEWRDEALTLIGKPGAHTRVNNIYGSADAGPMAFETPATIALRRAAVFDSELHDRLFTKKEGLGGLFQYMPEHIYFEDVAGELALTKRMPLPLIRYNIHDVGRIHDPNSFGSAPEPWKNWPVLAVDGRTDVAIMLYALNIYPDNIAPGLASAPCTGAYLVSIQARSGAHSEQLVVDVELKKGVKPSPALKKKVTQSLLESLREHNSEFRKLESALGKDATPLVRFHGEGELETFEQESGKALMQTRGKKPRISIV